MPFLVFSSRLQKLMDEESVSKRKLSTKTQVDRKSITTYLQGECLPRWEALTLIADFFEVSADYLLGREEETGYCYRSVRPIEEIPALFVRRLKELMDGKSLSQTALSKKLHMQQASVSKWLRQKSMPETFVLMDLSDIFDYPVDYFLGREQKSSL